MTDFNEFDHRGEVPQQQASSIVGHALNIYKGIFLYALAAMAFYFLISWILQLIFGIDARAVTELRDSSGNMSVVDVENIPNIRPYGILSGVFGLLTAPLYAGLLFIANKYNQGLPLSFSDLFIGYRQNFINIVLYSFLSGLILSFATLLCVFPVFFVAPLLMLGYPFLLFENATAIEAIKKSYNIAKDNYGIFLVSTLLGMLASFLGVFLCFVGVIATAPFIIMVMYSLYCAFVGMPRQIITK